MARLKESAAVREEIAGALRLNPIGPWAGHPLADERLPGWVRPSNWYLTGFWSLEGRRSGGAPTRTWTTSPRSREKQGSAATLRKTAGPRRRASSLRPWG